MDIGNRNTNRVKIFMKKRFFGYSIKEVDAILEVISKENYDLKRQISKMDIELSHQKAKAKYLETYFKELQEADNPPQNVSNDNTQQVNSEIMLILKNG